MVEHHFLAKFGLFFQHAAMMRPLKMAPAALLPFGTMQVGLPKQIFGLLSFSLSNHHHGLAIMVVHRGACRVKIE